MQKIIKTLLFVALFFAVSSVSALPAIEALQITDDTPIAFSEKRNLLVVEDRSSALTIWISGGCRRLMARVATGSFRN
jgi:thioredoxin-related protein